MKLSPKILPWFTMGAGGLGFVLRLWLFAGMDEKGLLPANHISQTLLFILFALVVAVTILCARPLGPVTKYSRLFPVSLSRAIGCALCAAGCLYAGICCLQADFSLLQILTVISALAATISMGCVAFFRLKGSRPSFLFHGILTVFFMFYTVYYCQAWGTEPQVQAYSFPLLAHLFLMLYGYYLTVLSARKVPRTSMVFFSQLALFCCCLSLVGENSFFFLTMISWLVLDLCSVETIKRAAPQPPEEA